LRDFSDVQVITRGVHIVGRVTDEAGNGIADAKVASIEFKNQQSMLGTDIEWKSTDPDGHFKLPHLKPSNRVVIARAKGHAPEKISVNALGDIDDANIRLKPAKVLAGKVVDSKGNPIEGAFVNVDNWKGFRGLGVFLASDKDGRFRWDEAPEDAVSMNISATGRSGVSRLSTLPGEDHVFTLRKALVVNGSIRDIITKKRVLDQCELEIGVVDPASGNVKWGRSPTLAGGAEIAAWASRGDMRATLDAETETTYQLRIKCRGYATFVTRSIQSDEGEIKLDVVLAPPDGKPMLGVVLDPDGKPIVNAEVVLAGSQPDGIQIVDGKLDQEASKRSVKTDTNGRFSLPPSAQLETQDYKVIVIHDRGYAETPHKSFEADTTLRLKPWGRIEGVYKLGNRILADRAIGYFSDNLGNPGVPAIHGEGKARTDAEGRFSFDHVPPGDVRVAPEFRKNPEFAGWSNGTLVEVKAGEIANAPIGGTGRAIVAKVVLPEGFDTKADYSENSEFEIESDRPNFPRPKGGRQALGNDFIDWSNAWWKSPEGHAYRRTWIRRGQIKLGPDCTIRVDDLPPGEYKLSLTFSAEPIYGRGAAATDRIVFAKRQFTIPETPGGRSDEPFDLGMIHPGPRKRFKPGEIAPAFEAKTLDGKPISLADFKGKFVLLDFWATWCGPCVAEIPELKAVREKFRGDDRFVVLSLSLDAEVEAARKFVADKGIDWPQAHLGEWSKTDVPQRYGVEAIPAVFLIGPDGKVIASGLQAAAIGDAVAKALERR
jgi:peroxiredoxin